MEIIFFTKSWYYIYIWVLFIHTEGQMNVLKKINKMRLDRNWSIYRLSVESGISQSTLTNMFNRETLPSITTLECICSAFGITMSEFFRDNEEKNFTSDSEFITLYNSANDEVKKSVLTILKEISKNN